MSGDVDLHYRVGRFLAHEADLLDSGDFEGWLALFADEGAYWVPSSRDQTDKDGQVSIMLEDVPLLTLRVARLSHPRAYAVAPPPATVHLVGNVTVEAGNAFITARSKIVVHQVREDVSSSLGGSVTHHLLPEGNGFKILLKRVDLIQAGGTFNAMSIPV